MDLNFLVTCVLMVLCPCHEARAQIIDLQFALFTSGPGGSFDSKGAALAIQIAQEQIFKDESILYGYNLTHTPIQDTKCNRTISLDLFFQTVLFTPDTPVLGLLGCGCSVASEPVAEVIHQLNIPQVSYASTNILFDDNTRFGNFFRTTTSAATIHKGIGSVLEYYGWNKVAFITQTENVFTSSLEELAQQEMDRNRNLDIEDKEVSSSLHKVQEEVNSPGFFPVDEHRVFFINAYDDVGRIVICAASKLNLTYPRYAWVTYGWYRDRWWSADVNNFPIDCSDESLATFIGRVRPLYITTLPTASDPNAMTDTGLTANEFERVYAARLNTTEAMANNFTYTYTATAAYDATWVLAIALNKTVTMINSSEEEIYEETGCNKTNGLGIVPLENFTYDNEFMGCVIRSFVQQTNFSGVSGEVSLDKFGTRIETEISILQHRQTSEQDELQRTVFAYVSKHDIGTLFYLPNESNETVFPDGVPKDGTPMQVTITYHLSLVIIYYVLAAAGLVFTAICLLFNFVYRERKIVRLTSPKLNYFIVAGGFILYVSIFIRIIPSESQTVNTVTCNLETFLNTVGYCLAFGTILAKMGRVYYIFRNPGEKKKTTLQDWKLVLIILGITLVGTILAILQVSVPQLRAEASLVSTIERTPIENESGVQINYMAFQCFSLTEETTVIIIITFVYFALLQIIGLVLAIQTRKVTVKVLNDSAYIAALIYISSISLVVFVLITFTLQAFVNIYETLFSGGVLLVATAFLALTFVPKMVSLYRDPEGEKIFDTTNSSELGVPNGIRLSFDTLASGSTNRNAELESKVADLETKLSNSQRLVMSGSNRIEELKSKVADLEAKLSHSQRGEEPNENSTPGNLENNAVEEEYTSQITGQGDT